MQGQSAGRSGEGLRTEAERRTGGYQQNVPVPGKMKFPIFDGEEVEAWLYRCQQFFDFYSTPEESKIKMVSVNVTGSTLYWHQSYMRSKMLEGIYPRWIDYTFDISARFSNRPYENPYSDLKNLSQTGTLREYIKEFDFLFNKAELREEVAVGMFVGGLKKEIQGMVLLLQPRCL